MARPIWRGNISFGLVSIPVELHSAENRGDIHFHLIDSRDVARVRYQRINSETGEEVPWDKIVKGYEYADGSYVLLSDEELQEAMGEVARSIDIQEFVDPEQIPPMYFEKPYYLMPGKQGEKGYVLLREALANTKKIGIAQVAIRSRQHLAALMPQDNLLTLNLLRYPQELKAATDFEVPDENLRRHHVSAKEVQLATQLIKGMTAKWKPEQYQDETREALSKLIERKVKEGKTEVIEEPETAADEDRGKTINFIQALKRSVAQSASSAPGRKRRAPSGRRSRRKKKAG
jgi:DNA end-binding protein Ku